MMDYNKCFLTGMEQGMSANMSIEAAVTAEFQPHFMYGMGAAKAPAVVLTPEQKCLKLKNHFWVNNGCLTQAQKIALDKKTAFAAMTPEQQCGTQAGREWYNNQCLLKAQATAAKNALVKEQAKALQAAMTPEQLCATKKNYVWYNNACITAAQKAAAERQATTVEKQAAAKVAAETKKATTAAARVDTTIQNELKIIQAKLLLLQAGVKDGYIDSKLATEYSSYAACLTSRLKDASLKCGPLSVPVNALAAFINKAKAKAKDDARKKKDAPIVSGAKVELAKIITQSQDTIAKVANNKNAKVRKVAGELQTIIGQAKTLKGLSGLGLPFGCCESQRRLDAISQVGTQAYLTGLAAFGVPVLQADGTYVDDGTTATNFNFTPPPKPKSCEKDANANKPACLMWQMQAQSMQENQNMMQLIIMIMNKFDELLAVIQEAGNQTIDCNDPANAANVYCTGTGTGTTMPDCSLPENAGNIFCVQPPDPNQYYDPNQYNPNQYQPNQYNPNQYQPPSGGYDNSGFTDAYAPQSQSQRYTQPSQQMPSMDSVAASDMYSGGGGQPEGLPSDYVPYGGGSSQSIPPAQQQVAAQYQPVSQQAPSFYTPDSVAAAEIQPGSPLVPDYGAETPSQGYTYPQAQPAVAYQAPNYEPEAPSAPVAEPGVLEEVASADNVFSEGDITGSEAESIGETPAMYEYGLSKYAA
jgi:hypothetical protein